MDPLSVTASIIAVLQATAVVVRYISDVQNAPKERSRCEQEMLNTYTLLANLRDDVSNADTKDSWFTALSQLSEKNGPLDQYHAALLELDAKARRVQHVPKIWKALTWPLIKDDVSQILAHIERLKALTSIALQRDHLKLSLAIKADVKTLTQLINATANITQDIRKTVTAAKSDLAFISHGESLRHRQEVLDWLSQADVTKQQQDLCNIRQPDTGTWIFTENAFVDWSNGYHRTLFCPGHPGTGKSVMTALVVDHLSRELDPDEALAYWYFNYRAQDEQDLTYVLAGLLRQLVEGLDEIPDHVLRLYNPLKAKTPLTLQQATNALQSLPRYISRMYIVLDALDECKAECRSSLLDILHSMQGEGEVLLLATSRLIPNIERLFEKCARLEIKAADADIARYARNRLVDLSASMQKRTDLQIQIVKAVVNSTKGMFLLARLYIDAMKDMMTINEWKAMLTRLLSLSRSFTEDDIYDLVYEQTMERICGQSQTRCRQALRILSWIVVAKRELSATELQYAVAVRDAAPDFDEDDLVHISDLLSLCAGLVIHDVESDVVRIVHYTAQQYLRRHQTRWLPEASLDLANTCLTYLSYRVFSGGPCEDDDSLTQRAKQNPLLMYTAYHWMSHAHEVDNLIEDSSKKDSLDETLAKLLSDRRRVLSLVQVPRAQQRQLSTQGDGLRTRHAPHVLLGANLYIRGTTGYHVAARFGFCRALERLQHLTATGIDEKDQFGRTPLSYAAENGSEDVVSLLLKSSKVDLNKVDSTNMTPLAHASKGNTDGHTRVAGLLLNHTKINIHSEDYDDMTPLLYATENAYPAMIRVLLESTDPNKNSNRRACRSALAIAIDKGHPAAVDEFLDFLRPLTNTDSLELHELIHNSKEFQFVEITEEVIRILVRSREASREMAFGNASEDIEPPMGRKSTAPEVGFGPPSRRGTELSQAESEFVPQIVVTGPEDDMDTT